MSYDMWSEASRDIETERRTAAFHMARSKVAVLWPMLAPAESEHDLDNRLAFIDDRMRDAAEGNELTYTALVQQFRNDWRTHAADRKTAESYPHRDDAATPSKDGPCDCGNPTEFRGDSDGSQSSNGKCKTCGGKLSAEQWKNVTYIDKPSKTAALDDQGMDKKESSKTAVKYRAEVTGIGENTWSNNAMEYDTPEEAKAWLDQKKFSWTGYDMGRVVPADTPKKQPVDMSDPAIYQNFRTGSKNASNQSGGTLKIATKCSDCGQQITQDGEGGSWHKGGADGPTECPRGGTHTPSTAKDALVNEDVAAAPGPGNGLSAPEEEDTTDMMADLMDKRQEIGGGQMTPGQNPYAAYLASRDIVADYEGAGSRPPFARTALNWQTVNDGSFTVMEAPIGASGTVTVSNSGSGGKWTYDFDRASNGPSQSSGESFDTMDEAVAAAEAFIAKGTVASVEAAADADTKKCEKCGENNWSNAQKCAHCGAQIGSRKGYESSKTAVSLTNVGVDPGTGNGTGTDPSGKRVQFKLSDEDRQKLKDILLSDLAINFSGVDVDESEIITTASKTAEFPPKEESTAPETKDEDPAPATEGTAPDTTDEDPAPAAGGTAPEVTTEPVTSKPRGGDADLTAASPEAPAPTEVPDSAEAPAKEEPKAPDEEK